VTFDPRESEGVVFRDKRRIDPETGEVREPPPAAAAGVPGDAAPADSGGPAAGATAEPTEAEVALAERTADLQRLQAEYVNYKRRVDRDRSAVREQAVASVLVALLPVLDDIGRAREHNELTGGFKAVAESLQRTVEGFGLQPYGEVGDPFDPRVHEALMHGYSDEVSEPICQAVLQVGYRLGERILRAARVAVAEPAGAVVPETSDPGATQPADASAYDSEETVDTHGSGDDNRER